MPSSAAYGSSLARGHIRAAAGLHHGHSHAGSEPHLWPTPQLTATLDPYPTEQGQGWNPHPHGCQFHNPLHHNGNSLFWLLNSTFSSQRCKSTIPQQKEMKNENYDNSETKHGILSWFFLYLSGSSFSVSFAGSSPSARSHVLEASGLALWPFLPLHFHVSSRFSHLVLWFKVSPPCSAQ